jgi:hypothetical protein
MHDAEIAHDGSLSGEWIGAPAGLGVSAPAAPSTPAE